MHAAGSTNFCTAKVVEVDLDVDADADTFGFLAEGALANSQSTTTLITNSGRGTYGRGNFADNTRHRLRRERVFRVVALACSEGGPGCPRCVQPILTVRTLISLAGGNQYDYICTLLETEPAQNFLGTLENEYEDFERLWDLYEWRRATDPQAIVPFLAFLLRRGVLLKAPSLDAKSAEDCIASVQPEIVTEAFSTLADGQWNIDDASS